jgi:hypothetical protein
MKKCSVFSNQWSKSKKEISMYQCAFPAQAGTHFQRSIALLIRIHSRLSRSWIRRNLGTKKTVKIRVWYQHTELKEKQKKMRLKYTIRTQFNTNVRICPEMSAFV